MPEAEVELHRLIRCIEELAAHLTRYHYAEGSLVGRNLRAELEGLEVEAHDLEMRIIEVRARTRSRDVGFDAYHFDYVARQQRRRDAGAGR